MYPLNIFEAVYKRAQAFLQTVFGVVDLLVCVVVLVRQTVSDAVKRHSFLFLKIKVKKKCHSLSGLNNIGETDTVYSFLTYWPTVGHVNSLIRLDFIAVKLRNGYQDHLSLGLDKSVTLCSKNELVSQFSMHFYMTHISFLSTRHKIRTNLVYSNYVFYPSGMRARIAF